MAFTVAQYRNTLPLIGTDGFTPSFVADLVALELGDLPPAVQERTRAWVLTRMSGAGDVARLGLRLAGALIAAGVCVRTGRPYARLPGERRRAVAGWLAGTSAPVAAEYVRAARSLAVTYAYDAVYATAP
jgi:hypothetical protein